MKSWCLAVSGGYDSGPWGCELEPHDGGRDDLKFNKVKKKKKKAVPSLSGKKMNKHAMT